MTKAPDIQELFYMALVLELVSRVFYRQGNSDQDSV